MLLEQDPPLQTLPHASSPEQTTHETRRDETPNESNNTQNKPRHQTDKLFKSHAQIQNVLLVKKTKWNERGIENLRVSTMVADDDGGATRRYRKQHDGCAAAKETTERKPRHKPLSRFC